MTATANLSARNNEGVPTAVNVGNALQPSTGQALIATNAVTATWQTLPVATTAATGTIQLDGNASDIQNTGVQAAGSNGKAADSGHVHFSSGMYLCAPTQYTPASHTVLTSSSTVLTAVSSTNINTGAFAAPTSGNVVVTASFVWGMGATAQFGTFGLSAHTVASTLFGNVVTAENNAQPAIASIPFLVTGLSAATSYNFDLLFAASTGSSTVSVYAQGLSSTAPTAVANAPVTMTVQAV